MNDESSKSLAHPALPGEEGPTDRDGLRAEIYELLASYRLQNWVDEDGESGYPLVDALSNGAGTIAPGLGELEFMADAIAAQLEFSGAVQLLDASQHAEQPRGDQEPDPKLCDFYRVTSWGDLVAAQEEHVLKLQDAARRNVKPWDDTFPPTLLPKYLRDTGLVDADKVSAYEVSAPSIGYWTAVKKGITAESIAEDHRAAGVTDTIVTRLYAAQPRPEHTVGDGVDAAREIAFFWRPLLGWALGTIDELNDGPLTAGEVGEDAALYQQARSLLGSAPRPAVATPAEVTDDDIVKALHSSPELDALIDTEPKARIAFAAFRLAAALTAQCQVRKDEQGVNGAWRTKPITDPDNPWRRAVEHAGYLVSAIEHYVEANGNVNIEADQVESADEPSGEQIEALNHAHSVADEARKRMYDLCYEFTKRRDRAIASLASPSAGAVVPRG